MHNKLLHVIFLIFFYKYFFYFCIKLKSVCGRHLVPITEIRKMSFNAILYSHIVENCPTQQYVVENCPTQQHVVANCPTQQNVVENCPMQQYVVENCPTQQYSML